MCVLKFAVFCFCCLDVDRRELTVCLDVDLFLCLDVFRLGPM